MVLFFFGGQYHFNAGGQFRPYVGAGLVYDITFSTSDGALKNFQVANAFGGALQLGAEMSVAKNINLFIDAKQYLVSASATGTVTAFGGAPSTSTVHLNPTVVSAGVGFNF